MRRLETHRGRNPAVGHSWDYKNPVAWPVWLQFQESLSRSPSSACIEAATMASTGAGRSQARWLTGSRVRPVPSNVSTLERMRPYRIRRVVDCVSTTWQVGNCPRDLRPLIPVCKGVSATYGTSGASSWRRRSPAPRVMTARLGEVLAKEPAYAVVGLPAEEGLHHLAQLPYMMPQRWLWTALN